MTKQFVIIGTALLLAACATTDQDAVAPANAGSATTVEKTATTATEEAADGEAKTASATEEKKDKIICRKEMVTGSRMTKKVCRTAADIKARAESDKDALRQMRTVRSGSQDDMQGVRSLGN